MGLLAKLQGLFTKADEALTDDKAKRIVKGFVEAYAKKPGRTLANANELPLPKVRIAAAARHLIALHPDNVGGLVAMLKALCIYQRNYGCPAEDLLDSVCWRRPKIDQINGVVPTLIKQLPLPLRLRFIGDMSQTERILLGLDLRKSAA